MTSPLTIASFFTLSGQPVLSNPTHTSTDTSGAASCDSDTASGVIYGGIRTDRQWAAGDEAELKTRVGVEAASSVTIQFNGLASETTHYIGWIQVTSVDSEILTDTLVTGVIIPTLYSASATVETSGAVLVTAASTYDGGDVYYYIKQTPFVGTDAQIRDEIIANGVQLPGALQNSDTADGPFTGHQYIGWTQES